MILQQISFILGIDQITFLSPPVILGYMGPFYGISLYILYNLYYKPTLIHNPYT